MAEDRAARATTASADLKKQLRSANARAADLERRLYERDVYTDPEQQLRHEIETARLLGAAEPDRGRYPVRPFTLGPEFFRSVAALQGISRERIIDGCVDVVTRRAHELNSRQVRRTGSA